MHSRFSADSRLPSTSAGRRRVPTKTMTSAGLEWRARAGITHCGSAPLSTGYRLQTKLEKRQGATWHLAKASLACLTVTSQARRLETNVAQAEQAWGCSSAMGCSCRRQAGGERACELRITMPGTCFGFLQHTPLGCEHHSCDRQRCSALALQEWPHRCSERCSGWPPASPTGGMTRCAGAPASHATAAAAAAAAAATTAAAVGRGSMRRLRHPARSEHAFLRHAARLMQ